METVEGDGAVLAIPDGAAEARSVQMSARPPIGMVEARSRAWPRAIWPRPLGPIRSGGLDGPLSHAALIDAGGIDVLVGRGLDGRPCGQPVSGVLTPPFADEVEGAMFRAWRAWTYDDFKAYA